MISMFGLQGCTILNGNFKAVEKNNAYRSGQLKKNRLENKIVRHNIKTVISLRGPAPGEKWYDNELEVCQAHHVSRFDVPWSRQQIPSPESMDRLLSLIEEQPKPILFHCQSGVHRTAIASAIYQLNQKKSIEVARKEIGFFFMKAPIGDLLDLYPPSHASFSRWVLIDYPDVYANYVQRNDRNQ
jgi:protein tyrosine/serine phosphatase